MIFDKSKVEFTGTEYIDYLQFKKDNKKVMHPVTKQRLLKAIPYFIASLILLISLIYLLNGLTTPPEPIIFTWNGILMFLAISAGIAWILHGFGFILVRR